MTSIFRICLAPPLAFAVLLVSCSADETTVSAPSARHDSPVTIRVLSQKEIASIRDSSRRDFDPFEKGLRDLEAGQLADFESRLAMEKRFGEAKPRLEAILANPGVDANAKVVAAEILWIQGETSGREYLFVALDLPDRNTRAAAAQAIWRTAARVSSSGGDRIPSPSGEQAIVLKGLLDNEDTEIRQPATQACVAWCFDLAEPRLVELFSDPNTPDRSFVARFLAEKSRNPVVLRQIGEYVLEPPEGRDFARPWILSGLREAVKSGESPRADIAYEAMETFFRKGPDAMRNDQNAVRNFCDVARASSVPILMEILNGNRDLYCRGLALEALARFDEKKAVDIALASLGDRKLELYGRGTLHEAIDDENRERILSGIHAYLSGPGRPYLDEHLVEILIAHGGEEGRKRIEAGLAKMNASTRMRALWRLEGFNAKEALKDLMRAGALPQADVDTMLKNARLEYAGTKKGESTQIAPCVEFQLALSESKGLHMFDSETDAFPCRHDLLIFDLCGITRGKLAPFAAREDHHEAKDEDDEYYYTVGFGVGKKWIEFKAEDMGDWYDVGAVEAALNEVARIEGLKERFIALEPDGQCALYLFADPDVFMPLARKYGISLAWSPDKATQSGKDFEKETLKDILEGKHERIIDRSK